MLRVPEGCRVGNGRLAAHMGVSLILFLAAVGGWGAYAYNVSSDRRQERALREQVTRSAKENERVNADLRQLQIEADRNRQALDQARRDLAFAQQQITSLTEQLRARERAAAAPAGAIRAPPASAQPVAPPARAPRSQTVRDPI
jgi:uncharacterized protein HemX